MIQVESIKVGHGYVHPISLQPIAGYVAYDVLIIINLEGDYLLSDLVLLSNSFEPSNCSTGNEVYSILESHQVKLPHLLVTRDAEISLTAKVYSGYRIIIVNSQCIL